MIDRANLPDLAETLRHMETRHLAYLVEEAEDLRASGVTPDDSVLRQLTAKCWGVTSPRASQLWDTANAAYREAALRWMGTR